MALRPEDFVEELEAHEAEWGERGGREVVRDFDDPDAAYWAVRRDGVGVADRSERETLVVTGDDTIKWLQGLITSDLLELIHEGSGQWSCVPNVNGRMVGDLRILHLPQMLLIDLEPGTLEGGLMSHFRQQIIMEDVQLDNRSDSAGRLGVHGPQSAELLADVGRWEDDPSELEPFDGTWGQIAGVEIIVQAMPVTGAPGYDLTFERARSRTVWRALFDTPGPAPKPVGDETMETLRIEAGVPRFGVEMSNEIIPLEANLDPLISFEKGCYVGQEIIARLDTRGTPAKRLRTLVFEGGAAPEVGAELEAEGSSRSAGTVVSSTWSPLMGKPIALAYVKRNFNDVGTELEVEGRVARVEAAGHPLDRWEQSGAGVRRAFAV